MYGKSLIFAVLVYYVTTSISNGIEFESLRVMGGYPSGFLSDCPGSTKEASITKSNLIHLSFVHLEEGNFLTAKRTDFNYFRMRELAKKLDFTKKTVLYMNGYLDSSRYFPSASIMGSIYTKLGYNVLLLEYQLFTAMIYPQAARVVRPVGRHAAEMLATLTTYGLDPKKLEILGLSLGGHGISFIAKHYRYLTGKNISRVTGLDPAGPCFRYLGPEDRLDASDADLVDVLHTNIDGYGMSTPLGHVDYYINGGEFQLADFPEIPCSNLCSHLKSFILWIAAGQYADQFVAVKCNSIQDARDRNCFDGNPLVTNLLGPKADGNSTGLFYLPTRPFYPFYLGKKGTKRHNDPYLKFGTALNADDVMTV